MEFSTYVIKKNSGQASALFYPGRDLPSNIEVSTPFTFPFLNLEEVVLAKDKMGWWNPVGGHVDLGETWQEALTREAYEEAGVEISNINIFGYVLVTQGEVGIAGYSPVSLLPMTWSKVSKFDEGWVRMETLGRKVCTLEEARELFELRNDNHQMTEILDYLLFDRGSGWVLPD